MAEGFLPPVVAELRANITDFNRKMGEARGEMARTKEEGGGHFSALAGGAGAALAGIGAAAVAVGGIALHMADNFEKAHALLVTAVTNSGHSMDKFKDQISALDKQFEHFGYTNAQTEDALARLTSIVHDPTKAIKDLSVAADIAAARHMDLTSASNLVGRAMEGSYGQLVRLGVITKDQAKNIHSQDEALRLLAKTYGGAAAGQADTFAGKMAQLKATSEDLAKNLGMRLIPIIEDVVKWFLSVVEAIEHNRVVMGALREAAALLSEYFQAIGAVWKQIFSDAALAWDDFLGGFQNPDASIGPGVGRFEAIFLRIGAAVAKGVKLAKLAWDDLVGGFQNPDATIGSGVGRFERIFLMIGATVRKVVDGIKKAWGEAGQALDLFIGGFKNSDVGIAADSIESRIFILGQRVRQTFDAIPGAVSHFAEEAKKALSVFAGWFADHVIPKIEAFAGYVKEVLPSILEAFTHIFNAIKDVVGVALFVLYQLWKLWGDDIYKIVKGALEVVANTFRFVLDIINGDWGKAWDSMKKIMKGFWDEIEGAVGMAWDLVSQLFIDAWEGIKKTVFHGIRWVVDGFLDMAGTIIHGAAAAFGWIPGIGDKLKDARDSFDKFRAGVDADLSALAGDHPMGISFNRDDIAKLNTQFAQLGANMQATGGNTPSVHFTGSVGRIPLASGGVFDTPTNALIGEAGREAVIPLTNPRRAQQVMNEAGIRGGGDTYIDVNVSGVVGSGRDVALTIRDELLKIQRSTPLGFAS